MQILWISYINSWTPTLANSIKKGNKLSIIVPTGGKNVDYEQVDDIDYYYLHIRSKDTMKRMSRNNFERYQTVITKVTPDIIHVHGTELNFAQIQNYTSIPVIISIQGILQAYRQFRNNYLQDSMIKPFCTIKNRIGCGGYLVMNKKFDRGTREYEKEILQKSKYFFCRTNWDRAQITFNNPQAQIFQGEELLRPDFYQKSGSWNLHDCQRYSIFMPSGFNPIKGMYLAVKTLGLLKKLYPHVSLNIPGIKESEFYRQGISDWLFGEEYIRYTRHLILKNGLKESIHFLGRLNAEEMATQMQKANVFLSPSSIDNSPNAVGEATMIGMPIVTTAVGGVLSMLKDEVSCLFTPAGDEYTMAYQIMRLFESDSLATNIAQGAYQVALKRHNKQTTVQQYLNAYQTIIEQ